MAERLILVNPARGCKLPKMEKREMKVLPEEKIRPYLMEADKRGTAGALLPGADYGAEKGRTAGPPLDGPGRGEANHLHHKAGDSHQGRTGGEPAQDPQFHPCPAGLAAGGGAAGGGAQEAPGKSLHVPVAQDRGHVRSGLPSGTAHEKILKAIGAEHIRFHDLRHTFATLSLKNGVDVKTLSNTLGHYSAGFTLSTYTHATPDMMREAADTMGDVIGKVM